MSGIPISNSFTMGSALMLDDRAYKKTLVERDNIESFKRVKGLQVFVEENNTWYYLKTGITNADWDVLGNGSSSSGGTTTDTYSNTNPTTINFCGISSGTVLNGKTAIEILNLALNPYEPPTVNLTSNVTNEIREYGNSISNIILTATTNKLSNNIISVKFYKDTTLINTVSSPKTSGGMETYNYNNSLSDSSSFKVIINDGSTDVVSNIINYTYVYPYYIGTFTTMTPTENDIKGLTKQIVNKGDISYNYSLTDSRFIIAYPQSYGALSRISDNNGFNITKDFYLINLNLTLNSKSIPYNIYIFNNITTQNNFNIQFKF